MAAQNYVTAADQVERAQRRGIRAGRIMRPAPIVMPGRFAHAYLDDEPTTFCGQPVRELHEFPHMPFQNVNPYLACPECLKALDEPA